MEASFARTLTDGSLGLPALMDAIETFLDNPAVPPAIAAKFMLVFDEVVSNALNHGHIGTLPTIDISIAVGPGTVRAEVIDDGKAFDPLAAPPPDTTLSAQDRPIGGLGILLVRKLMDDVTYTRENGRNRLRFSKHLPVEPKS